MIVGGEEGPTDTRYTDAEIADIRAAAGRFAVPDECLARIADAVWHARGRQEHDWSGARMTDERKRFAAVARAAADLSAALSDLAPDPLHLGMGRTSGRDADGEEIHFRDPVLADAAYACLLDQLRTIHAAAEAHARNLGYRDCTEKPADDRAKQMIVRAVLGEWRSSIADASATYVDAGRFLRAAANPALAALDRPKFESLDTARKQAEKYLKTTNL